MISYKLDILFHKSRVHVENSIGDGVLTEAFGRESKWVVKHELKSNRMI